MPTKQFVYIRTQFRDFHKWGGAPDEVSFLKFRHRHVFHVKVMIEVLHDNRELEYFILQKEVDNIIENDVKILDENKSCEMMARVILEKVQEKYVGERFIEVEVSEDGENGSIISNS